MNTSEHNQGTADDLSSGTYESRTGRLPALRDAMRGLGVERVRATYEPGCIEVALYGAQGSPLPSRYLDITTDLCDIFDAIVAHRYPGTAGTRRIGTFDWDLLKDLLAHRYVVTIYGL